jgi:hypothetical protein
LGFLYWCASPARYWPLAALHGIVMTATRVGGLPVAFCPLAAQVLMETGPWIQSSLGKGCTLTRLAALADLSRRGSGVSLPLPFAGEGRGEGVPASRLSMCWQACGTFARSKLIALALVGTVASLGGLGFFAYCQWRFGAWNAYLQTQQAGWNVHADWAFFLRPVNYIFFGSTWHPNVLWPDDLSRLVTWATLAAIVWLVRYEVRLARQTESQWQSRLVFYLAAIVLWVLHAAGVSPILLKSMIRYCLPVHALVLLAAADLVARGFGPAWPRPLSRRRRFWLAAGGLGLAALQAALLWRFLNDQWVA